RGRSVQDDPHRFEVARCHVRVADARRGTLVRRGLTLGEEDRARSTTIEREVACSSDGFYGGERADSRLEVAVEGARGLVVGVAAARERDIERNHAGGIEAGTYRTQTLEAT